jgi:hypothetical protein
MLRDMTSSSVRILGTHSLAKGHLQMGHRSSFPLIKILEPSPDHRIWTKSILRVVPDAAIGTRVLNHGD